MSRTGSEIDVEITADQSVRGEIGVSIESVGAAVREDDLHVDVFERSDSPGSDGGDADSTERIGKRFADGQAAVAATIRIERGRWAR